jgi:hypothetical protein
MTESELFDVLDLNSPVLQAVQDAGSSGDLGAAKQALGTHIRSRTEPRWLVDRRDQPLPSKKADDFPKAELFCGINSHADYWRHLQCT